MLTGTPSLLLQFVLLSPSLCSSLLLTSEISYFHKGSMWLEEILNNKYLPICLRSRTSLAIKGDAVPLFTDSLQQLLKLINNSST